MRYRPLGGTGMQVSVQCLGTMMLGSEGNTDHEDCIRIVHTALDHGINFIDTADMYCAGESEEIVGKALAGRRDDVILATKGHFPMGEGPNRGGNSRRWIIKAVDDSLRRLRTDWIDLYQIHRPDHTTDIEETLGALTDLVRQGKIRAFGSSSYPAEEMVEAQHVAERRGLYRFRTEQPPYSILSRAIEGTVLPVAQRHNMGILTWSPLAWGFLSGKHRKGQVPDYTTGRAAHAPERFNPADPVYTAKIDVVEQLVELAADLGYSLPELAVAFPVAHPVVTSVILGPRTTEQLDGLLKGASLVLDDEVLDRIDAIVPPGTEVYNPNGALPPQALKDPALRRRPVGTRAAADL
jgi:aryl-alcohol dehydrogenase-like predicted oxidoreductase